MLFMFGFGAFIGFALGACLTLYMIDKEFVFADDEKEEPTDIFTYVKRGRKDKE